MHEDQDREVVREVGNAKLHDNAPSDGLSIFTGKLRIISAIMKSNGETLTIGELPKSFFDTSAVPDTKPFYNGMPKDLKFDVAVEHFSAAYLRAASLKDQKDVVTG